MKVQWRLVDVKTNRVIPVGEEFELVDGMETYFSTAEPMAWLEAVLLTGDPLSIRNPMGILGTSPIEAARKALI